MLQNRSKEERTRSGKEILSGRATSTKERTLHFKAIMIIMILIRINQYHMGEKRNQDQIIRVEKESLARVRSNATMVKVGDTLQMNVEVQM